MVRLSPAEYRLLRYVTGAPPVDLSRSALAAAAELTPNSVSRILRGLLERGVVLEIVRGPHRRIVGVKAALVPQRNINVFVECAPRGASS